jgi:hypothetical protein
MKKVVFFAFRRDPMCFIHVLLNTLDMKERGFQVKVVVEGEATHLVPDFREPGSMLHGPFKKAFDRGLIEGICRACAQKMGTLQEAEEIGLKPLADMAGHPSMGKYMEGGWEIITF